MTRGATHRPESLARTVALAVVAGVVLAAAAGRAADPPATALFDDTKPLALALEAPWRATLRERASRPEIAGVLVLRPPGGAPVRLDAEIKLRGKWRLENCSTPPLTLRLGEAAVAGTILAGQTALHASIQCRDGDRYAQQVFREHLAYRFYAALTEVSLRTRRVEITFRDTESGRPPRTRHGFLVEDIGLATKRLGYRWVEAESVAADALAPGPAALFSLFQYLIGHTDWSILESPGEERCCHNAAVFAPVGADGRAAATGLVPVPYDFDASGLVDSGEIPPPEILPIRSVRQRWYRGLCLHGPELAAAIERMRAARSELTAQVEAEPLLDARARRATLRYLDEFYETIEDPERRAAELDARCRG